MNTFATTSVGNDENRSNVEYRIRRGERVPHRVFGDKRGNVERVSSNFAQSLGVREIAQVRQLPFMSKTENLRRTVGEVCKALSDGCVDLNGRF